MYACICRFEFARQLAIKGYNLLLFSRSEEKLSNTRKRILAEVSTKNEASSIQIRTLAVDFTSPDIYEKIEKSLDASTNDIFILVNNVGICPPYPQYFTEEATGDHLNMIDVNIVSTTRMTQLVLPSMVSKGRGLVVNVSSIAGRHLFALSSVYAATKAYVGQLSECLALEYRNSGITFCTLYPSAVSTKMIHNASQDWMTASPERYVGSVLTSIRHTHGEHWPGYWTHSLLEWTINLLGVFTGREFVCILIERCSLGYQALVKQMEAKNTDGVERFHMWNAFTKKKSSVRGSI